RDRRAGQRLVWLPVKGGYSGAQRLRRGRALRQFCGKLAPELCCELFISALLGGESKKKLWLWRRRLGRGRGGEGLLRLRRDNSVGGGNCGLSVKRLPRWRFPEQAEGRAGRLERISGAAHPQVNRSQNLIAAPVLGVKRQ